MFLDSLSIVKKVLGQKVSQKCLRNIELQRMKFEKMK